MKNSIPLSQKILIFIGFCLPEIGYKFSYSQMLKIFADFYGINYSIKTLRKEFSNLKKAGLITAAFRYRKKIPALTRGGRLKIIPRLPHKKFDPWDSKWRMVIFSIPEPERKYRLTLQQKLSDLSFQKIQKGVYISPHPLLRTISRTATELGIRQNLTLIEADKIDRERVAIQKIWNLSEINQQYRNFIHQAQKLKPKKFWPLSAKQLEQKFSQIYQQDPHLPADLLPKDWQANRAYRIYKKIATSY